MGLNYLLIMNRIRKGYKATHDEALLIFRKLLKKLHIAKQVNNFLEEGKALKKKEEQ